MGSRETNPRDEGKYVHHASHRFEYIRQAPPTAPQSPLQTKTSHTFNNQRMYVHAGYGMMSFLAHMPTPSSDPRALFLRVSIESHM